MDRVLLVEDEPGIREALCDFLRMQGVSLSSARDVADACRQLASDGVDCLVTDENLPDGSGREIIDAFLRAGGRRALLATANPSEEIKRWVDEHDGVELAAKPLRPGMVLSWLRAGDSPPSSEEDEGKRRSTAGPKGALALLVDRGLLGEELERCMILILALDDDVALVDCRREGGRALLVVDAGEGRAEPNASALTAELGVQAWVGEDGSTRFAVPLPWRRLACGGEGEVVDMRDEALSPFDRVVDRLSRARDAGQRVANLASWHRAALELSSRHDLIPSRARADEHPCPERELLLDRVPRLRTSQQA